MALEESAHTDDRVWDEDGIKITYTESVGRFIPGMKVDFIPGRFGGLVVKPGGFGSC
jgi:Fe-S cluster assembly iron-binding protein IscA